MGVAYLFVTNGRVDGIGNTPSPGTIKVDIPENHEVLKNPFVFKYLNGQLIKDATYQAEKIKEEEQRKSILSAREEIKILKKQNADLQYLLMMKGVL